MSHSPPLLLFAVAMFWTSSQAQGIEEFLQAAQQSPGVAAAAYQVQAREAGVRSARNPALIQGQAGYVTLQYGDTPPCQFLGTDLEFVCSLTNIPVPEDVTSASASLVLTPVVYGAVGHQVKQAQKELEQARLDYADARSTIEGQALVAALRVRQAERGLELAQQGLNLAQAGLAATQIMVEKGAANERDLRQAQLQLAQAQSGYASAEAGTALAQAGLRALVGDTPAPAEIPPLPYREGTALDLLRTQIQVDLAQDGLKRAQDSLVPTASASYTWHSSARDSAGVSITSQSLQPTVTYNYQNPPSSSGGLPIPGLSSIIATPTLEGEFVVGVGGAISFAQIEGTRAAAAGVKAAQAGLAATQSQTDIQAQSLRNQYETATREYQIQLTARDNAQANLNEDQERARLGLLSPLQLQASFLSFAQAELDLQSSEVDLLTSITNAYAFYGIAPSEVLK